MWRFSSMRTHASAHEHQRDSQRGVTLIELVISIVIIGIAAAAILQSLGFLTINNVDPMLRSQANMVAQSTLNEVLSQSFFDGDDDPRIDESITDPDICPTPETGASYDRRLWDNLCDYNGFDSNSDDGLAPGIRDRQGNALPGLSSYRVQVTVDTSTGLALGTLSNTAGCTPRIARITVTASDPRGQTVQLTGYRTSYWDEGC
ncbi:MAG: prepilin-type N-terminal cleavage/methylation domain-containing protein [Saccharospirillum sp.]|uniref:prepilin-type N-terminal cleavage/methylation domain-containing protein n=1 Tax=Saccharospirillum sp. TaxID=2033801 RepID=UPI0032999441